MKYSVTVKLQLPWKGDWKAPLSTEVTVYGNSLEEIKKNIADLSKEARESGWSTAESTIKLS